MARVTKFNATTLADALLNETSLFWDSSQPGSGLVANSFFLDTSTNAIYQNTGTEGSPTWTKRVGGESAEQSSTPNAGDSAGSTINNIRWYGNRITLPTTEAFYIITAVEWKNGDTVSGTVVAGVDIVDADTPVQDETQTVAVSDQITQSGTNAVQKTSNITTFQVLPAGAKVMGWVNVSDAAAKIMFEVLTAGNTYKTETHTATPKLHNNDVWVSHASKSYLKIYFKGYL